MKIRMLFLWQIATVFQVYIVLNSQVDARHAPLTREDLFLDSIMPVKDSKLNHNRAIRSTDSIEGSGGGAIPIESLPEEMGMQRLTVGPNGQNEQGRNKNREELENKEEQSVVETLHDIDEGSGGSEKEEDIETPKTAAILLADLDESFKKEDGMEKVLEDLPEGLPLDTNDDNKQDNSLSVFGGQNSNEDLEEGSGASVIGGLQHSLEKNEDPYNGDAQLTEAIIEGDGVQESQNSSEIIEEQQQEVLVTKATNEDMVEKLKDNEEKDTSQTKTVDMEVVSNENLHNSDNSNGTIVENDELTKKPHENLSDNDGQNSSHENIKGNVEASNLNSSSTEEGIILNHENENSVEPEITPSHLNLHEDNIVEKISSTEMDSSLDDSDRAGKMIVLPNVTKSDVNASLESEEKSQEEDSSPTPEVVFPHENPVEETTVETEENTNSLAISEEDSSNENVSPTTESGLVVDKIPEEATTLPTDTPHTTESPLELLPATDTTQNPEIGTELIPTTEAAGTEAPILITDSETEENATLITDLQGGVLVKSTYQQKIPNSEDGVQRAGATEDSSLGVYIIIGMISVCFLALLAFLVLRKRSKRQKANLDSHQDRDPEKAVFSNGKYKEDSEENNVKNNEITPLVIKQNSQINKFEKNANLSLPKNLNTAINEKNIEKDNVLKSTQAIIEEDEDTKKAMEERKPDEEIDGTEEETKALMGENAQTEKVIVRTHVDQDSIPKKTVLVTRNGNGYQAVSQDPF